MQGFVEFIKALGATRIAAMAAVTLTLVGFFAFLILRVTAPQMTPLFTDLSLEDSTAIVKDLERQGVLFEMRNDGATIMVPKDKVTRLRMKLAEGGLPKGGGIGYEIFDKSDALGATSFVQNINHLRALEGELARTIRAIDRVQAARVHLVLPERPLFSRDKAEASASIVLKVRGALESQQVRAIRHLVASAVNGLKPERVSIVDESGRLLADGALTDSGLGVSADERQAAYERRLRDQIEGIVTSIVGPGRARVQVSRRLRFQSRDADLGEVRSGRPRAAVEPDARGAGRRQRQPRRPGHGRQRAAGRGAGPARTPRHPREQSRKSEEIVNYEISRSIKTEVTEGGRVNRVSVAVLVDGTYTKNDKGELAYPPREKEEIDRIAALVRTAIGFDQKRGDQVEVVNLRFAEVPTNVIPEPTGFLSFLTFTKDDVMRWIELAVMTVLGLVVLLFVVRPLVRRIITPDPPPPPREVIAAAIAGGDVHGAIAAGATADDIKGVPSQTAKMIDIAQVQGQVHAQSVQKVGELADRNPHETVSIIRSWLHENAA